MPSWVQECMNGDEEMKRRACAYMAKHLVVSVFGLITCIVASRLLYLLYKTQSFRIRHFRTLVLLFIILQTAVLTVPGIMVFIVTPSDTLFGNFDSLAKWCMSVEFLVVSYFFSVTALRSAPAYALLSKMLRPFVALMAAIFTGNVLYTFIRSVQGISLACGDPVWVIYDLCNFCDTVTFFVAGIALSRRMNHVIKTDHLRSRKKKQMWILLTANVSVAVICVVFDSIVWQVSDIGCNEVVRVDLQPVIIVQRVVAQFPQAWVAIGVFWVWYKQENSRPKSLTESLNVPLVYNPSLGSLGDRNESPFGIAMHPEPSKGLLLQTLTQAQSM